MIRTKPSKKRKTTTSKRVGDDGRERTIQHLRVPGDVHAAMKRIAIAETAKKRKQLGKSFRKKKDDVTVGHVYDWACDWFISQTKTRRERHYELPKGISSPFRSVWLDSEGLDQVKKLAAADEVSNSRIIHTAAVQYLVFRSAR